MSAAHVSGWGCCGCEWPPRGHDPGCLWRLDQFRRQRRRDALQLHPLLAPDLALDAEWLVIRRIRLDQEYARRWADGFAAQGVAA